MKGKIITGRGLTGLSRYVNKSDTEHIDGSCRPADFLRTCAALRSQRPDVRQAAVHISISQPPGQPLTADQWQEAGEILMHEMQMQDMEFQLVRHHDTEHDHCHLIVCKIKSDGTVWNDSHSARRLHRACEKIEQEMNLQHTLTVDEHRDQGRPKPLSDGALRQFQRTGAVPNKTKEAIQRRIKNERENAGRKPHPSADGRIDEINIGNRGIEKINTSTRASAGATFGGVDKSIENNQKPQILDKQTSQSRADFKQDFSKKGDNKMNENNNENDIETGGTSDTITSPEAAPVLGGRLRTEYDQHDKNVILLYWQNRPRPTFSYRADERKIELLAKPDQKNVSAFFDICAEKNMVRQ
jgi:hypothetical protein